MNIVEDMNNLNLSENNNNNNAPSSKLYEMQGYYTQPTIYNEKICFVSEGDLYLLNVKVHEAIRLTVCGSVYAPCMSKDGTKVAFTSYCSGESEVYLINVSGGPIQQITNIGEYSTRVVSWDAENENIIYITKSFITTARPDGKEIYALNIKDRSLQSLELGEASSYQNTKTWAVLGRHTRDNHIQEWKHYNGGNIGQLWIRDKTSKLVTTFNRICKTYNISTPLLYESTENNECKVFFVADPNGKEPGNLFVIDPAVANDTPKQITFHKNFYVRNPQICTFSKRIVYQCGGDLYTVSIVDSNDQTDKVEEKLNFNWRGSRQGRMKRILEDPMDFFQSVCLHPDGHLITMVVRGKLFEGSLFEGPLVQKGLNSGITRYSFARYLRDGRIITVALKNKFENQNVSSVFEIYNDFDKTWGTSIENQYDGQTVPLPLETGDDDDDDDKSDQEEQAVSPFSTPYILNINNNINNGGKKGIKKKNNDKIESLGTVIDLIPSLKDDLIVVLNHRLELIVIRYETNNNNNNNKKNKGGKKGKNNKKSNQNKAPSVKVIDKGIFEDGLSDISFSPCGLYVCYTYQTSRSTSLIRIANVYSGKTVDITKRSEFCDHAPSFDTHGRYIYFLSDRQYRPVDDEVWGGISIPSTDVPMLVLLQNDLGNPFNRCPARPGADGGDDDDDSSSSSNEDDYSSSEEDSSDDSDDDRSNKRKKGKKGKKGRKNDYDDDDSEEEEDMFNYSILPYKIDIENIENRLIMIPNVKQGHYEYSNMLAIDKNNFVYIRKSISKKGNQDGGEDYDSDDEEEDENNTGSLMCYNLSKRKESVVRDDGVFFATITMDRSSILIVAIKGNDEKVCFTYPCKKIVDSGGSDSGSSSDSDDSNDDGENSALQTSGIIRINSRISVEIDPVMEWKQMFSQAWQAQANEFVFPDLIQWETIYALYEPLLNRISTRVELSDLMKELTSEMACSHIYCDSGDTDVFGRCNEDITQGFIGADINSKNEITRILRGDFWSLKTAGPLAKAGMNIREGDRIVSVNHKKVDPRNPLSKLLRGLASKEIYLGIKDKEIEEANKEKNSNNNNTNNNNKNKKKGKKGGKNGGKNNKNGGKNNNKKQNKKKSGRNNKKNNNTRIVRVRCIERDLVDYIRYKDDLNKITKYVHGKTDNKVGYIHVPDMSTSAYIQWSRAYNVECENEALIIDIRGNAGGNISDLLLEKINTKCIGYDIPRYGKAEPFPSHIPCTKNIMVLLCDEQSCSDADCFAQAFKTYQLGLVIGMKTWGGVYGISEETKLVDGTAITHPSSAFYTLNVNWELENNGVTPDIVVEISPDDFKQKKDPQLDRAIEEILRKLNEFDKDLDDNNSVDQFNLHNVLLKGNNFKKKS